MVLEITKKKLAPSFGAGSKVSDVALTLSNSSVPAFPGIGAVCTSRLKGFFFSAYGSLNTYMDLGSPVNFGLVSEFSFLILFVSQFFDHL